MGVRWEAGSLHLCITNIEQKNLSNPTKGFYGVKVHESTGSVEAWWVGGGREVWAGLNRWET